MSKLKIQKLVLGVMQTNCYVISDIESKEAYVIDPADNEQKILQILENYQLKLKGILLTHGHFDHIYAAGSLAADCSVKIYAGELELELLGDSQMNASSMFRREYALVPDVLLKDGEILQLGEHKLQVLSTPGHTIGGICFYCEVEAVLFSGDTLFFESVGRSDFATGNSRQLIESINEKLFPLGDSVIVYPGHGDSTSIGYEKENNLFMRL